MSNEFEEELDGVDLDGSDAGNDVFEDEEDSDLEAEESEDDNLESDEESEDGEATEQPAKTPEKGKGRQVPLHALREQREKRIALSKENRELKLRVARYEAEQAIPPSEPVKPTGKSPMETFIEKEGEDSVAPVGVLRAQREWDQQQVTHQQTAAAADVARRSVLVAGKAMTDEVMGEGLGLENLAFMGRDLLDAHDHAAIRAAGPKAGQMMYDILLSRLRESQTPQGRYVRAAIRKSRTASTPDDNPTGRQKPVQRGKVAPSREEVLADADEEEGSGDMVEFLL